MSKKRVKILDMFTTPSSILGMSRFYENPRNQPSVRPRFSLAPQTRPDAEPPNQTRTLQSGPPNQTRTVPREPLPGFLETLGNLVGAANPLSNYRNVGESTIGLGVGRDQANVYAPQTTGAIADTGSAGLGDVAKDLGLMAVGGVAGKAIGAGLGMAGRAGKEFVTDPTVQARTNALMGRMYHGNQGAPWEVAINRPLNQRDNWFKGDLFGTPNRKLAKTYASQGSEPTSSSMRALGNLPKDLKVLDLMPGGKSVAEQSPGLAEALGKLASGFDNLGSFNRHSPLTNLPDDTLRELMAKFGFNGLRHVSGQGSATPKGSLAKPVYAFFNPAGMTSKPASPGISDMPGVAQVFNSPSRFMDTIQEGFEKKARTLPDRINGLPSAVQTFLRKRGLAFDDEYDQGVGMQRLLPGGQGGEEIPYRPYDMKTLMRKLEEMGHMTANIF